MLELENVGFSFNRQAPLFQGVDLTVGPGERVELRAPSGFGKTTLCRILAGYLEPSTGTVRVDGGPLPKRGVCPVQLVGQHPEHVLDPRMRMAASLDEGWDAGRKVVADEAVACKTVSGSGASSAAAQPAVEPTLLEGLGIRPEWLRRFPHELSGGEQQRFVLARALAARPRFLVADEMTTMLDAVSQAAVWRFVLRWAEEQDMGLVFVTHSPALARRVAMRTVDLTAFGL